MRTMSASLQAAIGKEDRRAAVAVRVADLPPEAPRLSGLASRYTGAEPDAPFDAAPTAGGTIVRAYISGGVVKAQVKAVTDSGATWGNFVTLDPTAGNFANTAQVAVRGSATDGTAQCFWVESDGHTIKWSQWDGSLWGAAATVVDAGAGKLVSSLASDGRDGTIRLFYVVSGGAIYETHWNGSVWSASLSDGGVYYIPTIADGFSGGTGLSNDHFIMICSASPTTMQVKQFKVGTGSGWGGAGVLLTAGTDTGYGYRYPKLTETSPSYLRAVICWSEESPVPGGTGPMISFTPSRTWATGIVPWRYGGGYGVKVFRDFRAEPEWWVINSKQVYTCAADTGSLAGGQRVDFDDDDVVELRISQKRANRGASASVTVLNDDGYLSDAGQAGEHLALRAWSQVALTLGYHTGQGAGGKGLVAGDEGCWQSPWWIESVAFHEDTKTGRPLMTLQLVDAWALLERWAVRSSYSYVNATADTISRRMLWMISGDNVTPAEPRLTGLTLSTFTLRSGEAYALALRRICEMAGVVVVFGTFDTSADGTGADSVSFDSRPWGQGTSVWEYGGSGQPIVSGQVAPYVAPGSTGAQVVGAGVISEARNWDAVWGGWRDLPTRVTEASLDTQGKTDAVAANVASLLKPETGGGELVSWVNPGIEIGDVVTVTVTGSPVVGELFTVAGQEVLYERYRGTYRQTLQLEGVS